MVEKHWAKKKERGSYWGIVIVLRAYQYGGHWLMRLILAPVITYFFLTGGAPRRASLDFLRRVHSFAGEQSPFVAEPGWRQSWYHFWQFGLHALAKIDAWVGKVSKNQVRNCGDTHFDDLEKQPKGGILIGSHLGNLEVARALASKKYTRRMNVLVFTQHAQSFNRALKNVNPKVDIDLIQVTDIDMGLTILLKERIEQGEFVVIVGDRTSVTQPGQTIDQEFLGKPAAFALGPWILASVLECPVYFLFCLKNSDDGHYDLYLNRACDQLKLPRKSRREALQPVLKAYSETLEKLAIRYPYQWFNFFDFWKKDSQ
ncbi:acetyltransferase [Idiomarina abyssalis]|jgi:predicted LPLAT superfamily acyltransferase|uniref:Acetyltransferase n=1 Tax=Idiomarina abyssalis TaxID=86102 RepID=A0A8I1GAW0_9GAMM|nr:acetyltransferase [Idiomarina abyssalis]MBJ7266210.1 acetyltransferase [Idiomarina abyssalis]MBJ7272733.1 acetyltransferase [Idiomarina abyssalis]MBJ7316349.1 acetyltransferase [Idiomarina abyssalis]MDA6067463.1 acetyltransferase [Idiomarina abyssalis]|tara:strand:+ start:6146 stop:7090 length:945 start_codon:yes stop_codon:yes gene_type:complete